MYDLLRLDTIMDGPSTRRSRSTLVVVLVSVCCLAAVVDPGVLPASRSSRGRRSTVHSSGT
jgi:hypothetical protein